MSNDLQTGKKKEEKKRKKRSFHRQYSLFLWLKKLIDKVNFYQRNNVFYCYFVSSRSYNDDAVYCTGTRCMILYVDLCLHKTFQSKIRISVYKYSQEIDDTVC